MGVQVEKPQVRLVGRDGNAFAIMGACKDALKKAGRGSEVDALLEEMMSGDYDNLLRVAMKWFDVS